LKLDSNKANLTAEGHRLNNLPVPSMPWRPCTDMCFFLLNINYRQIKSTQLNPRLSNAQHRAQEGQHTNTETRYDPSHSI